MRKSFELYSRGRQCMHIVDRVDKGDMFNFRAFGVDSGSTVLNSLNLADTFV